MDAYDFILDNRITKSPKKTMKTILKKEKSPFYCEDCIEDPRRQFHSHPSTTYWGVRLMNEENVKSPEK